MNKKNLQLAALTLALLGTSGLSAACGLGEPTRDGLQQTLAANQGTLVLVFCAKWSPYCANYEKTVARTACRYRATPFLKVDLDRNIPLARSLGITELPTTLFLLKQEEMKRTAGGISPAKLDSLLRQEGLRPDPKT